MNGCGLINKLSGFNELIYIQLKKTHKCIADEQFYQANTKWDITKHREERKKRKKERNEERKKEQQPKTKQQQQLQHTSRKQSKQNVLTKINK